MLRDRPLLQMAAGSALLLIVLTIAAMAGTRWFWPMLEIWRMAPRVAFTALPPLPADAYGPAAMWLARPDLPDDPARYLPPARLHAPPTPLPPGPVRRGAAYVFFIHPTTFMGRNRWNAALDHANSRMRARLAARSMASPFNAEAGIFAPYYRQAAMGTFLIGGASAEAAQALAESDVRTAFAAFLRSIPRDAPIVLVGHGQGALIILHILRNAARTAPIASRVVAAYLAGWPISAAHDLPATGLDVCTHAAQTGCVMGWTTFAQTADPRQVAAVAARYRPLDGVPRGAEPVLCTNPLTGGARPQAPAVDNLGSLATGDEERPSELVMPSVAARCDPASGLLMIADPPHLGDQILPGNNYTMYDFALFWRNLRADVAMRDTAWQREHHYP